MFYFEKINGKKILKSDLIKSAQAFFTTREICICDKSENNNSQIKNNQKIISDYLKIDKRSLIFPVQTHSANIEIAEIGRNNYPDTDALILTNKGQAVFLNFADCTPIIFYDEKQNIGAVAHAGWRGTAQKIAYLTVQKLINDYNSDKKDLKVLIGPAICLDCYSGGEEVFEQLKQTVNDFEKFYKKENGKIFVDLKNINKKQLTESGIENIDICHYCTCCNNEIFYSYRKENGITLRHSRFLTKLIDHVRIVVK